MTDMGFEREHFNPEEMQHYGFDPENSDDRIKWLTTEPARHDLKDTHDYSKDSFEFGTVNSTAAEGTERLYSGNDLDEVHLEE